MFLFFFLVSSLRDHSRISLRYSTPDYCSISNESFRFNQIMSCPGSVGGRNDTLFRAAIQGDMWRSGREINVGTNARSAKRSGQEGHEAPGT